MNIDYVECRTNRTKRRRKRENKCLLRFLEALNSFVREEEKKISFTFSLFPVMNQRGSCKIQASRTNVSEAKLFSLRVGSIKLYLMEMNVLTSSENLLVVYPGFFFKEWKTEVCRCNVLVIFFKNQCYL